jgi:hypothetical protein
MQIKIKRIEDGPAQVEVSDPASGEVISTTDVNVGQEVIITTSDNAENPPYVGEVVETQADPEVADAPAEEEPPASV